MDEELHVVGKSKVRLPSMLHVYVTGSRAWLDGCRMVRCALDTCYQRLVAQRERLLCKYDILTIYESIGLMRTSPALGSRSLRALACGTPVRAYTVAFHQTTVRGPVTGRSIVVITLRL